MTTPAVGVYPKAQTVFGNESATIPGVINAALVVLVALFGTRLGLDDTFIALAMAVVTAAMALWSAWATADTRLGLVTVLINAGVALVGYFGYNVDPQTLSGLLAAVAVLLSLYQRTQTSPVTGPVNAAPVVAATGSQATAPDSVLTEAQLGQDGGSA